MGWFGRILTFETLADSEPPLLEDIARDASEGLIECDAPVAIVGYAAMGRSIHDAIEPIIESFAIDLNDDGSSLRSPVVAAPSLIGHDDLGSSVDGKAAARVELAQIAARALPSSLTLTFYDPNRDYQAGQARSETLDQAVIEQRAELPAVVSATDARALAEDMIARRWSRRDKLTLRLPPTFVTLAPGSEVETELFPMTWQVQRSTIDGLVVIVELQPLWKASAALVADPGQFVPPIDVVVDGLALALVELPDLTGHSSVNPTVYLAASSGTSIWKRLPVHVSNSQFSAGVSTARRKTVMGFAQTILGDGVAGAIDTVNSVELELVDPDQWLTSCDDDALAGGSNLALVGDELLQFGDAAPIGTGRFVLTRLLRGRYATDWATSTHAGGDLFLLIDPSSLQPISLPSSARGTVVTASCQAVETEATASRLIDGRSLRTGLFVDGDQVVGGRAAAIAGPSGGANVDPEARAAVTQILTALREHGLIQT